MSQRTICMPNTAFGIFLLGLCFLQILCLIPLLFNGFFKSLKDKKRKTLPKLFKIVYWMICFVLLIAGVSFPTNFMLSFKFFGHEYCENFYRILIGGTIAGGSYMLSLILICLLYFVRLYLSFKNSLFSLSKHMCFILIFGILIQFSLLILFRFIYSKFRIALYHKEDINIEKIGNLIWIFYDLFAVTNIIYNVILLALLLTKIHKLLKLVTATTNNQNMNVTKNKIIIKPVIIYVLCLSLTFFSTLIQSLLVWMRNGGLVIDSNELYMIHQVIISWDIFINALSIHLQFEPYSKCFSISANYLIKKIVKKKHFNTHHNDNIDDNDNDNDNDNKKNDFTCNNIELMVNEHIQTNAHSSELTTTTNETTSMLDQPNALPRLQREPTKEEAKSTTFTTL